jgi:hypothetical protein
MVYDTSWHHAIWSYFSERGITYDTHSADRLARVFLCDSDLDSLDLLHISTEHEIGRDVAEGTHTLRVHTGQSDEGASFCIITGARIILPYILDRETTWAMATLPTN